ncbi:putative small multi-drug export protein [compost metagenome]
MFDFFGKFKPFKKIIDWSTEKAQKKISESKLVEDFVFIALFVFVAVPLPGTGAWIGSLIANFLELPPKKAMPPIILGVLAASLLLTFGTVGLKSLM